MDDLIESNIYPFKSRTFSRNLIRDGAIIAAVTFYFEWFSELPLNNLPLSFICNNMA